MANPNFKENKFKRFLGTLARPIVRFFSKKAYVSMQYRYITKHKMDWKNPVRYTQKLQYLRLYYYKNDLNVIRASDRISVRDYLNELGLAEFLIPIYGLFDSYEDIDFSILPSQFVLKATHGSNMNYICLDKNRIDHKNLKKIVKKWIATDYGKKTVEPHYSKIKPRLIIEKYLGDENNLPTEYKIHTFNGVARYLYVVNGRGKNITYDNLYIDWTPFKEAQFNHWNSPEELSVRPENFDKMIQISQNIAKIFPFCRVDLYSINNNIYFGEATFTPAKGTLLFDVDAADYQISTWLDITSIMKSK